MEYYLNIVWDYLYGAVLVFASRLDLLLTPIHTHLGPAAVIFLLALATVCITKFMGRTFRTKRHVKLEKEFHYWLSVREEALQCEDLEKGKRLARNIDQAKLNKSYYDYFFEGLLLSLANTYFPVLLVLSYVNRFYRPDRLLELTGREYLFQFGNASGEPVLVGSLFFYLCVLFTTYLGWSLAKKVLERRRMKKIVETMAVESRRRDSKATPLKPITS